MCERWSGEALLSCAAAVEMRGRGGGTAAAPLRVFHFAVNLLPAGCCHLQGPRQICKHPRRQEGSGAGGWGCD